MHYTSTTTTTFTALCTLVFLASQVAALPTSYTTTPEVAPPNLCRIHGDILVECTPTESPTENPVAPLVKRGAYRRQPWPSATIPYSIDSRLPAAQQTMIAQALNTWMQAVPGLRFQLRTTETAYAYFYYQADGSTCASQLGYQGTDKPTYVFVGARCMLASFIHEIGHVLALEHEHQRTDRDAYVDIVETNLKPELQKWYEAFPDTIALTPYDYQSIMHYPSNSGSVGNQESIDTKVSGEEVVDFDTWAKGDISDYDVYAVSKLYNLNQAYPFYFNTTTEGYDVECPVGTMATSLRAFGLQSSTVSLGCKQSTAPALAAAKQCVMLGPISSTGAPHATCPPGQAVFGMRCQGPSCSEISLKCCNTQAATTGATLLVKPETQVEQAQMVSEESVDAAHCAAGSVMTGIRCSGLNCDNMQLTCARW